MASAAVFVTDCLSIDSLNSYFDLALDFCCLALKRNYNHQDIHHHSKLAFSLNFASMVTVTIIVIIMVAISSLLLQIGCYYVLAYLQHGHFLLLRKVFSRFFSLKLGLHRIRSSRLKHPFMVATLVAIVVIFQYSITLAYQLTSSLAYESQSFKFNRANFSSLLQSYQHSSYISLQELKLKIFKSFS